METSRIDLRPVNTLASVQARAAADQGSAPAGFALRRLHRGGLVVAMGLVLPLALLCLWQMAVDGEWVESGALVAPAQVLSTLVDFYRDGTLGRDLGASLQRVLAGFAIGSVAGVFYGTAAGVNRRVAAFTLPSFHVLRQVPVIAWLPVLILTAGFGEGFKIAMIAIAAFTPVALNTLDGIRSVSPAYLELGRSLCFSRGQMLLRIAVPQALPGIATGLRLALGRSWMIVVAAEMIASTVGVGYRMNWARQLFQIDIVFAGVVITGVVGLIIDIGLRLAFRRLNAWQRSDTP